MKTSSEEIWYKLIDATNRHSTVDKQLSVDDIKHHVDRQSGMAISYMQAAILDFFLIRKVITSREPTHCLRERCDVF